MVFTLSGAIATRDGTTLINTVNVSPTVSPACTGIKFYKLAAGTRYLVSVWSDDRIMKMDYQSGGAADGTWDDITGALSFNAGQNNLASFAIGEDVLLIEDGIATTAPYKWTGTGNCAALGGTPPNATVIAYHKRMAFAAGNSAAPSTVYYTDVGNIENWSTGLSGNFNVETNDGTIVRALFPAFDSLYIFKDSSVWRLTGDDEDNFALERMVMGYGTLCPQSVKIYGDVIYFVSQKGDIIAYDGGNGIEIISRKIDTTLDGISFSRLYYTSAEIFDRDYYVSVSTGSSATNDRWLVFNTTHQAWTKFTGLAANAFTTADDGAGKDLLVFGDYGGSARKYPSGLSDNGTAIDAYYTTKWFRFPDLSPIKDWRLLKVFAKQQGNYNLAVEYRKDFESGGTTSNISLLGTASLWDTARWDVDNYGGENIIVGRIETEKAEGSFFQCKFSNSNVSEPVEVRGFSMFMEPTEIL